MSLAVAKPPGDRTKGITRMFHLPISKWKARLKLSPVLRYGLAAVAVGIAGTLAATMRHYHLPHPFTSFSMAAIAITFWYCGAGPGLVALLLSFLVMRGFFVPSQILPGNGSSESYLIIYAIFGTLVSWFSASRRRAERSCTEARDTLELRVMERTTELQESNNQLQKAEAELRSEKDRLKLLLDLNNTIVSNLELRELLRVICGSVRQMMHCDSVSVNLPDPETAELKVYALDFPGARGFLREGLLRPADSLSGKVFRTGQPSTLLRDPAFSHRGPEASPYEEEGLNSSCSLPLISQQRVLGVLALSRFDAISFSQDDVQFLMQVANQVAIAVQNALSYSEITKLKDSLAQEKLYLEDEIRTEANFEEIIGKSAVLRRVLRQVETVAPTDSTVLIYGETGTGKELIARAIHNLSPRRSRTFVKMNCAAIPTGLLESELFGHERGAFTGAVTQRIGRLEVANQGSLFLDEIGEMPPELQPKLLRVLQEREFERLGSTRTLRADVRLIAATNRDLEDLVEQGKFRSDLFFRLNVFPIQMPPLRERPDDIPLLVRHFAQEFSRRMNKIIHTIPSEAMNAMCQYAWPGNIRELQNVIERAVILSQGTTLNVQVSDLQQPHTTVISINQNPAPTTKRAPVRSILAEVNRDEIIQALKDTGGRIGGEHGAAARLGLKRTTLISRMKKLGINLRPASEDRTSTIEDRVM